MSSTLRASARSRLTWISVPRRGAAEVHELVLVLGVVAEDAVGVGARRSRRRRCGRAPRGAPPGACRWRRRRPAAWPGAAQPRLEMRPQHAQHLGRGRGPGGVVDHHQQAARAPPARNSSKLRPGRGERRPQHRFGVVGPLHVGAQHAGHSAGVDLDGGRPGAPGHIDPHARSLPATRVAPATCDPASQSLAQTSPRRQDAARTAPTRWRPDDRPAAPYAGSRFRVESLR